MNISDLKYIDVLEDESVEGGFDISGLFGSVDIPQVPTSLGNLVDYIQNVDDPMNISLEALSQFYLG
ncbi:MAG: hypothetical protein AAGA75_05685 [Cyanobacteria bacterium P01_E01_bin.6]